MEKRLQQAPYLVLAIFAFLLPIWTIPGVMGGVAQHKLFLFVLAAAILALLWAARTVFTKRVWLTLSPLNVALVGAAAATAVSALLVTNPLYQLSGRFLTIAAAALILLFGTTLAPKLRWNQILQYFLYSGVILSVFTWLQLTPLAPSNWLNRFLGLNLPNGLLYSLADNHLLLLSFLIPVGLSGLIASRQTLRAHPKALRHVLTMLKTPLPWSVICLLTSVLVIAVAATKPELKVAFLPYRQGWLILIENFKSLRSLLFGIGPENFGAAFHRLRSVDFNSLPIWQLRFTSSSSEFFHTATTTGLLGLGLWSILLLALVDGVRRTWRQQPSLAIFLLLHVVVFFLLPFNLMVFFTLSLGLLALTNQLHDGKFGLVKDIIMLFSAIRLIDPGLLKSIKTQAGFSLVTALLVGILAAAWLFFAGRVYAASFLFELSRQAAGKNQVRGVYTFQQQAARLQPRNPAYRRNYALTNLTIARAILGKTEASDEDRVLVSQILSQSTREARLAAQLAPQDTENWEALANIYASILVWSGAEGADQWALATLAQAIQTDPVSPQLRLNLANLYFVLGNFDQALRLTEQAIQLKPDWGNAYITYGTVLEKKGEPKLAAQAYERAKQFLGDVEGADQLQKKIDEMNRLAAAKEQQSSGAIPAPDQPSLPKEQPDTANAPDDFKPLVEGKPPASSPTPEPTPVVLPSDVGF